jgi:FMN phosphatase YigB (HAD superfamily)
VSQDGAVSFDLFGTLVTVETPGEPATLVADELAARGIDVPDDWQQRYREPQVDSPPGTEISLSAHVRAALADSGVEAPPAQTGIVDDAVRAAFETDVTTRASAVDVVRTLGGQGPVGILSNCSVPGLVEHALSESALDDSWFDAVVTSVGCGWRKPDERAFETVANRLGVSPSALVHVGDDPETDGGAESAGATAVLLDDLPLSSLPAFISDGRPNDT